MIDTTQTVTQRGAVTVQPVRTSSRSHQGLYEELLILPSGQHVWIARRLCLGGGGGGSCYILVNKIMAHPPVSNPIERILVFHYFNKQQLLNYDIVDNSIDSYSLSPQMLFHVT